MICYLYFVKHCHLVIITHIINHAHTVEGNNSASRKRGHRRKYRDVALEELANCLSANRIKLHLKKKKKKKVQWTSWSKSTVDVLSLPMT